jgi:hypothetical protein
VLKAIYSNCFNLTFTFSPNRKKKALQKVSSAVPSAIKYKEANYISRGRREK